MELLFPLVILLFALPLFFQARRQKKQMQEQQKLQNSLTVGDRVMTTSGVYGTVVDTTDDTVDLELAPGLKTTWVRMAIREKVVEDTDEEETSETAEDESATANEPSVEDAKSESDSDDAKADDANSESEPVGLKKKDG